VSKHHHHNHESEKHPNDQPPPAASEAKPEVAAASDVKPEAAPTVDVQKLEAELAAAKDRELRVHAELDNYRKRASRELQEHIRYAELPLLRDLLPVLDNIDRALEAAEKNADANALLEGFKMRRQQLGEMLVKHHCVTIESLHTPFDPNLHHAILQQPSEEHPANTVLMVTQNGYQLHDRVVRPSQVIVSKPK
jgi:molecular chaperone GrpE